MLILLVPFALYLLLIGWTFIPSFLFGTDEPCRPPQSSETVVKVGEDDFAEQIERLCIYVIAEREKAYQNRQINSAVGNDEISYVAKMSASELKHRMSELGYECSDLPDYGNRIGCSKKYRYRGDGHRYSVSLTFDRGNGTVSFFSGMSTLISRYL